MIRHEAVRVDADGMPTTPLPKKREINLVVFFEKKSRLPPIATLRNVVRNTWKNDPCNSSHTCQLTQNIPRCHGHDELGIK